MPPPLFACSYPGHLQVISSLQLAQLDAVIEGTENGT